MVLVGFAMAMSDGMKGLGVWSGSGRGRGGPGESVERENSGV